MEFSESFVKTRYQDIEGTNGMLKRMATMSPNIGWELLSARVTLKKFLRRHQRPEDRDALIESCNAIHVEAMKSMAKDCLGGLTVD